MPMLKLNFTLTFNPFEVITPRNFVKVKPHNFTLTKEYFTKNLVLITLNKTGLLNGNTVIFSRLLDH